LLLWHEHSDSPIVSNAKVYSPTLLDFCFMIELSNIIKTVGFKKYYRSVRVLLCQYPSIDSFDHFLINSTFHHDRF